MVARSRVQMTAAAEADLRRIIEISRTQFGTLAARRLVKSFRSGFAQLAEFPRSGRVPEELESYRGDNLRALLIAPYRVFYAILSDRDILIFAIADGRRALSELLDYRVASLDDS